MKHKAQKRGWRNKRPNHTSHEIQELVALIAKDARVTKIAIVEPSSAFAVHKPLDSILRLPGGPSFLFQRGRGTSPRN